ncbi:hypothetical protein ACFL1C_06435 [Pseudomonadota bacterium]
MLPPVCIEGQSQAGITPTIIRKNWRFSIKIQAGRPESYCEKDNFACLHQILTYIESGHRGETCKNFGSVAIVGRNKEKINGYRVSSRVKWRALKDLNREATGVTSRITEFQNL